MINPLWIVAPLALAVVTYYSYKCYAKGDEEQEWQEEEQQEEVRQEKERQEEVRQEEERQERMRQDEQVWNEISKTKMLNKQREMLQTCRVLARQMVHEPGHYSEFFDLLSGILAFPDNEVTQETRLLFQPILHQMGPVGLRVFDKMVDKKRTNLKLLPTPFGGNAYNDLLGGDK